MASVAPLVLRVKNAQFELCLQIPTEANSEMASSLRAAATDLGCPQADERDLQNTASVDVLRFDDTIDDRRRPDLTALRETLLAFLRSTNRDASPSNLQTLTSMVDATIHGWVGLASKTADDMKPKTPSKTSAGRLLELAQSYKVGRLKLDIMSKGLRMYDDLRHFQGEWPVPTSLNTNWHARLENQMMLSKMEVQANLKTLCTQCTSTGNYVKDLLSMPFRMTLRLMTEMAALSGDDADSQAMKMLKDAQAAPELNIKNGEKLGLAEPEAVFTNSSTAGGAQTPRTPLGDGLSLHQINNGYQMCIDDSSLKETEKNKAKILSKAMDLPLSSIFEDHVIRLSDITLETDSDCRLSNAFRTAWTGMKEVARMKLVSATLAAGMAQPSKNVKDVEEHVHALALLGFVTGSQLFLSMRQQAGRLREEFPRETNDATRMVQMISAERSKNIQLRQGTIYLDMMSSAIDLYKTSNAESYDELEPFSAEMQVEYQYLDNLSKLSAPNAKGERKKTCMSWHVSFEDLSKRSIQELCDIAKITSRQEHNLDQAWERLSHLASAPEKIQEALQKLEKRKRKRRPKHKQRIDVNGPGEMSQDGVATNSWDSAQGADSRNKVPSRQDISDRDNDEVE